VRSREVYYASGKEREARFAQSSQRKKFQRKEVNARKKVWKIASKGKQRKQIGKTGRKESRGVLQYKKLKGKKVPRSGGSAFPTAGAVTHVTTLPGKGKSAREVGRGSCEKGLGVKRANERVGHTSRGTRRILLPLTDLHTHLENSKVLLPDQQKA